MNKRIIKLVTIVLAVLAAMQLGSFALAADEDVYKVRIYPGNVKDAYIIGSDEDGVWRTEVRKGSGNTGFNYESMVSLPADSKYYVKGIRVSGVDNDTLSSPNGINKDTDYVVAYGIKGTMVQYTVYYRDRETGNELAPFETHWGNVGDKPILQFQYIAGYEPEAYNLTKTILDNEGENEITFWYNRIVTPTPAPAPTPVVVTGDEEPDEPEDEEPEAPGEEEEVPEEEAPAAEEPGEETEEITEDETPLDNGPREIIDLDEEDTPLGESAPVEKEKTPLQQERETSRRNLYISGALLVAALAAIVTLAVMLLKKRGKNKT